MNTRWIRIGLSLLGVGGVGLTSWLSIRCHERAKEKATKKEKLVAYLPAIGSGVGTAACILGSHSLSSKEIAALTASCGYLAGNRDKIIQIAREKFGAEETEKMVHEAGRELVKKDIPGIQQRYERTGRGHERFLVWEQGKYFISDRPTVIAAEKKLNDYFFNKGTIPTWNDFYGLMHVKKDKWGEEPIIPEEELENVYDVDRPIEFDLVPSTEDDDDGNRVYIIYLVNSFTDRDRW